MDQNQQQQLPQMAISSGNSANAANANGTDDNATSSVPDNMFFLAYMGQGHSPVFILTALLLNCVGIPGFLMNFSVLLVTFRHRSLHGSANFLLALTSLFEMGHEFGHLLFLWMALSGQNFLLYWLAFRLMCVPIFCIGGIFSSMVSTGLDRLLCVLWPRLHTRLNLVIYLGLHSLFCLGICLWLWLAFLRCAQLYPTYPVTGYVSDLIIGECAPAYTYSSMASNGVTIGLYLLVGIIIRVQSWGLTSQSSNQPGTNQRLFRSLAVIILVNIGGYFYVSIMRAFVLPQFRLNSIVEWYFNSYDGILLNVSAAANAPILYFLSTDYRKAYKKEWAKLSYLICGNQISPGTQQTAIYSITRKGNGNQQQQQQRGSLKSLGIVPK